MVKPRHDKFEDTLEQCTRPGSLLSHPQTGSSSSYSPSFQTWVWCSTVPHFILRSWLNEPKSISRFDCIWWDFLNMQMETPLRNEIDCKNVDGVYNYIFKFRVQGEKAICIYGTTIYLGLLTFKGVCIGLKIWNNIHDPKQKTSKKKTKLKYDTNLACFLTLNHPYF